MIFRSDDLTEQLVACLKRSNESEGKLAAIATSLFMIQIGETSDELYLKFRDTIVPILRDESKAPAIRKHVCIYSIQKQINKTYFCFYSMQKQ